MFLFAKRAFVSSCCSLSAALQRALTVEKHFLIGDFNQETSQSNSPKSPLLLDIAISLPKSPMANHTPSVRNLTLSSSVLTKFFLILLKAFNLNLLS